MNHIASRQDRSKPIDGILQVLSWNQADLSVTVSIKGVRYEYFFDGDLYNVQHTVRFLMMKSEGIALNWIKRHSNHYERI